MKIKLLVVGKTQESYLQEGIEIYVKRLKHYLNFDFEIIPHSRISKNLSPADHKKREGELILSKLRKPDYLILLDEKGKQYVSLEFSKQLQLKMGVGIKNLVFVIGGPYGFSEEVYARANEKLSLSKMTFSHQMIRLFVVEQLYRSCTILKGEPYHHE